MKKQKNNIYRKKQSRYCIKTIQPAGIYFFKYSNGSTRSMCDICSKLTIKTPEQRQLLRSDVFIVNFEQMSHIAGVSIVDFEEVNAF